MAGLEGEFLYGVIGADDVVAIGYGFVRGLLLLGFTRVSWFESRSIASGRVGGVGRAIGWNHHWRFFRRPRSHPATKGLVVRVLKSLNMVILFLY